MGKAISHAKEKYVEGVAKRATSNAEQRIRGGSEMDEETDEMIARWSRNETE